jgi:hypothetical protein
LELENEWEFVMQSKLRCRWERKSANRACTQRMRAGLWHTKMHRAGPLLTCVGSIRVMFPIIAGCNVQMYPMRGEVAPRGGMKVIVPLPVSVPPVLFATHGPLHSGKVA